MYLLHDFSTLFMSFCYGRWTLFSSLYAKYIELSKHSMLGCNLRVDVVFQRHSVTFWIDWYLNKVVTNLIRIRTGFHFHSIYHSNHFTISFLFSFACWPPTLPTDDSEAKSLLVHCRTCERTTYSLTNTVMEQKRYRFLHISFWFSNSSMNTVRHKNLNRNFIFRCVTNCSNCEIHDLLDGIR